MTRRAFTLIELLVVITVILILVGLILVGIGMVREQARAAVVAQRSEEALRGLRDIGSGVGSGAYLIHQTLAATGRLDGVIAFKEDRRFSEYHPAIGDWIPTPYPDHCFQHPWGKVPTDYPEPAPTSFPPDGTELPIEAKGLSDLTASFSAELMRLAEILPRDDPATAQDEALQAYLGDRRPDRPWNDPWGRPLVLAMGLYQPRENTALQTRHYILTGGGGGGLEKGGHLAIRQDLFLDRAKEAYGFTRAIYLSAGSIGPKPDPAIASLDLAAAGADWTTLDTGLYDQLWAEINRVANTEAGTEIWRTDGTATPPRNPFANPPWKGMHTGKTDGHKAFIAAPVEIQ